MANPCQGAHTRLKILTYRHLASFGIPYSREWLRQLEARGEFPKRVQLGPNSIGWVEAEIAEWLAEKAESRAVERKAVRNG